MVTQDVSHLIIKGKPREEDLKDAWNKILDEYSELIKTDKSASVFDLYKKLIKLQWKMLYIDQILETLSEQYDEEDALQLVQFGYKKIENLKDRVQYLKQIEFVRLESMSLVVMLNQAYAEYIKIAGVNEQVIQRSEMDYEKELAGISKHQGYLIDKNKVTVFEWCAIVNNYLEMSKRKGRG